MIKTPLYLVEGDNGLTEVRDRQMDCWLTGMNLVRLQRLIDAFHAIQQLTSILPMEMLEREDRLDAAEFVDHSEDWMRAMRLVRDTLTSKG